MNRFVLPFPEIHPTYPEFANMNDISLVVKAENESLILKISAISCTIKWGDCPKAVEYNNIKEKGIGHIYRIKGSYNVSVSAIPS